MPNITPYPGSGWSNGSSSSSGQSFIGRYEHLPPGFSNAGGAGGENAYTRQVQPDELMGTRLNGLLAGNSPYIQQARQAGLRTAGSRGLLNSSIAAGNSEAAAINAAAPIAAQEAGAYGTAAGQDLEALNSVLSTRMQTAAQRAAAAAAAGASMYNADLDYRLGNRRLDYEGTQAGLGRSFADYMNRQNFGNQLRMGAFNLGSDLLRGNDQFNHQAYLSAMDNPFIMNDPQALQGYLDFGNQNNNSYYDDLFGFATNAGEPLGGGWQEDSPWYDTPGNYAPLPYWQEGGY